MKKKWRVYFQWGTIDEGVKELGEVFAKTKKEAIDKVTADMNQVDKDCYREYATAEIIK